VFTTPDGVAVYTQEDVDALNAQASTTAQSQFEAGTQYGVRCTNNDLNTKALAYFREVAQGATDRDELVELYNGLASALGWDKVSSLGLMFTVTVDYNGTTIATFEDVEADDASSAEDLVQSDMEIEDVEINFTISYNGDTQTETANLTYEFDAYELSFNADQQD
jgi:hypothetical protein